MGEEERHREKEKSHSRHRHRDQRDGDRHRHKKRRRDDEEKDRERKRDRHRSEKEDPVAEEKSLADQFDEDLWEEKPQEQQGTTKSTNPDPATSKIERQSWMTEDTK